MLRKNSPDQILIFPSDAARNTPNLDARAAPSNGQQKTVSQSKILMGSYI